MPELITFDEILKRIREIDDPLLKKGLDFEFEVEKNLLTLWLEGGLKYNRKYTISLDGIKTAEGESIHKNNAVTFTTQLLPFDSSVQKVKDLLQDLSNFFSRYEISICIRDASQKAYQYIDLQPDPNMSDYTPLDEKHEKYVPIKKYIDYFAAYLLITKLLSKLLGGDLPKVYIETEGGTEVARDFGLYEFKLGDFEVKPDSGAEAEKDPKKKAEALAQIFEKAKELEENYKREWKFWLDESMNRNKRGYSSVKGVSVRTDHYSPEDRDF